MKRSFSAPGRYWNLPVRNQGRPVEIRISGRDGAGAYTVQLIPGTPQEFDFIAGCSIPEYFDHELNLECEDESLLENVRCSDVPLGTPHFDAPHRQQLHYSVPFGWQNDPNGLFYYKGLYHLFHQHDPFTSTCGRNPHWHHAVSRDLIHWENRGIAIFPRGNATAYSGSAAVDERNVSGLGEDPATPPILLFYTSASPTGFTQNIAFSTDGGESFRPYPGNPVVPTMGDGDDRDPSIACDPEADEWLMCLFLGEKNWQFGVLRSPDLLHWEEVERFRVPGGCECPDLFRLYDEAEKKMRWVVVTATGRYLVGDRVGGRFRWNSSGDLFHRQADVGTYAGQSFKNVPGGRRCFIAWHWGRVYGGESSQSMTFPMDLKLRGGKLLAFPADELKKLRIAEFRADGTDFRVRKPNPLPDNGNDLWEIELTTRDQGQTRLTLGGVPAVFDAERRCLSIGGALLPYPDGERSFSGRIFLDRTTIEIFEREGRLMHSVSVDRHFKMAVAYGDLWQETIVPRLTVYQLRSIYETE